MKIAIVTETFLPSTDGIVTRLTSVLRWLHQHGHELLIIAPDLGVTEFEGIPVAGIPAYRFWLYRSKKLSLPHPRVRKLLHTFQPDLVHVVNPAVLGAAGVFYGKKWPLIASYHTNIPQYADYYKLPWIKPILWWHLRRMHNQAKLNLCTSNTVLTELKKQNFHNVQLWDRGVDTERFHPRYFCSSMREYLTNGQPDKVLLLYVGRLAPEKEIERLRDVLTSSPELRLAIVGDGPHRVSLEQYFAGTATVFTGFLHGEELAAAYASSDVFTFPSTTETLGLVLLEAMAAGTAVVAARSGPSAEQIEHGVTGMLYQPKQSDSLYNCILELLDLEKRQTMSQAARQAALQFGWEGPSRQLLQFYQQL